jgi:VWFA-related protein
MRAVVCSLVVLVAATAVAQVPTYRSRADVVLVPVLVKDNKGQAVYGLHVRDFNVEDDGVPQRVHLDQGADAEPISAVIAIQQGRSAPYEYRRMGGLDTMVEPILNIPNSTIAIVGFDDSIHLMTNFTNDHQTIAADLKKILSEQLGRWYPQPGEGGAAILDAVSYSVKLLNKMPQNSRRVLLLISETRDHGSKFTNIDEVISSIGDSDVSVFALAFSPSQTNLLDTLRGYNNDRWVPTPDLLYPVQEVAQALRKNAAKEIALLTGGEYATFKSPNSFDARLNDFTNHLYSRYLLSFEPKTPHPGLHHLAVTVTSPEHLTVAARSVYWATANAER